MGLKTYNLKDVTFTLNGIPLEGFGESDALTIEFNEDAWEITIGADGEMTRSRTNNESANGQLTVMQTSDANFILQAALLADKVTGRATFGFAVTDGNQGEVVHGEECFLKQSPSRSWNKVTGERVWNFCIPRLREEPLSVLDFGFPTF